MDISVLSSDEFHQLFENISSDELPFNYRDLAPMNLRRIMLIVSYCLLFLIGVMGNLWVAGVIGVVLHQTTTNPSAYEGNDKNVQIYILSLCTCDILGITLLIFLLSDLIHGQWMFPNWPVLCRLYLSGEFLNKCAGPILLTGLAAYCYSCICLNSALEEGCGKCASLILACKNLFNHCRGESGKAAVVFVFIGVALILILVAPIYIYADVQYVILHNETAVDTVIPKCALIKSNEIMTAFTIYGFILAYLIPSASFTFFYVSILMHVRRHNLRWRATVERSHNFWRVAKVTCGLVAFYLGCWTPYWLMNMIIHFTPSSDASQDDESSLAVVLSYFIHMLPYINCTGYPILYTVLNGNIKAAYNRAASIRRRRRRQKNQSEKSNSIGCFSSNRASDMPGYSQSVCSDLLTPTSKKGPITDCTSLSAL